MLNTFKNLIRVARRNNSRARHAKSLTSAKSSPSFVVESLEDRRLLAGFVMSESVF